MNTLRKLNYELGYLRRKWQAPAKLRRDRDYFERIYRSNSPETCKTAQEMMDEMLHLIRTRRVLPYRDLLRDYIESGLFRKGTDPEDFLFTTEWKEAIAPLMERLSPEDYIPTDNKQIQARLFRENGIRVPATLGILKLKGGKLVVEADDGSTAAPSFQELLQQHKKLFCKPVMGTQGNGCNLVTESTHEGMLMVNGEEQSMDKFLQEALSDGKDDDLLIQEVVQQHEALAIFHPESLNTLRIWSVRMEDGPRYFRGILRMGSGGACVDNAHKGGFIVDIFADGTLDSEGCIFSPFDVKPITEHPTTHIPFAGIKLPYFEEAKELVCAAHRLLPRDMFALGWDVAITPAGPMIIEVNPHPGIPAMQRVPAGGWRKHFLKELQPATQAAALKH